MPDEKVLQRSFMKWRFEEVKTSFENGMIVTKKNKGDYIPVKFLTEDQIKRILYVISKHPGKWCGHDSTVWEHVLKEEIDRRYKIANSLFIYVINNFKNDEIKNLFSKHLRLKNIE